MAGARSGSNGVGDAAVRERMLAIVFAGLAPPG
jgi:hypothetical protein